MPRRSVFICDEPDWARAAAWARAGLVGPSLWLVAPDGPPGPVVEMEARSLPDGAVAPLGEFLARDTDLERVQLIWCPDPEVDDLTDHPWNREARDAIPQILGMQFLAGAAVFAARPGCPLPKLSPNWARIVVGPEEAIVPGGAEAPGRDVEEARLHVALALGGAVAGTPGTTTRPLLDPSWQGEEVCATAFTSTLLGGDHLDAAARDHHERTLPWADAAEMTPTRFHDDLHREELVSDAVLHVLDTGEHPLRWVPIHPDELRFAPASSEGLRAFFRRFGSFIGFLFHHSRAVPWQARVRNAVVDELQGSDMGVEIERADDTPGLIPAPNVFELDRQQVELMKTLWREDRDTGAHAPSRSSWQAVIDTTNGLIDGSDLPDGLDRPTYHDRGCVVPPLTVLGFAVPEGGLSPSVPEEPGRIAGLDHAPASAAVAATAAARVVAGLQQPGPSLIPASSRASSVTARLAAEAAGRDAEIRAEQEEACGNPQGASGLSFLDEVRTQVLADRIGAGLFADRWFRLATGPLNGLIRLRSALFVFLLVGGVLLSTLLAGVNLMEPQWLIDLLGRIGIQAAPGQVWTGIGGLSTVLVIGPVVWFFYHYETYRTRAIRQAEARILLLRAARHARDEHRRLISADRTLQLWTRVLRGVYPLRTAEPEVASPSAALELPSAWTCIEFHAADEELGSWLRETPDDSRWRQRATHQLLTSWAEEHGENAAAIVADAGLPHGLLHELAATVEERWRHLADRLVRGSGQRLRNRILNSDVEIAPEGTRTWRLEAFLDRVVDPQHRPGQECDRTRSDSPAQHLTVRLDPDQGGPTSQVIASTTCIYQRCLEPLPERLPELRSLPEDTARF